MRTTLLASLLGLALAAAVPAWGQDDAATLVIGAAAEPQSTLDALVKDDGQRDIFIMNVYEGLTRRGPDGALLPLLATEWHSEGNDWVFKIREGVKFHDGRELTPADVVASLQRAVAPELQPDNHEMDGVTAMAVTDDGEVRLTTAAYDPTIPHRVANVQITAADWAAPTDHRLDSGMMGTGPYRFVAWNRGQSIELERFDDYWGSKGKFAHVTFQFMADPAVRLAALEAGEIQIAYGMSGDLADMAPKVVSAPFTEVTVLRVNAKAGPLTDPDLRRAVNLAIDRRTICEQLFGGYCTLTQGQPVIPQVFGFNPDLADYAYDPEEAKRIIAGKAAADLTLTMSVPVDRWPKYRELGQVLVNQLEAVGFKVDASYDEVGKWIVQFRAAGSNPEAAADLSPFGTSNLRFDSSDTFDRMLNCVSDTSAFCDQSIDEEMAGAQRIEDPEARRAALQAIWARLYDLNVWAPLFALDQVHFVAPNVEWTPSPSIYMYIDDVTVAP